MHDVLVLRVEYILWFEVDALTNPVVSGWPKLCLGEINVVQCSKQPSLENSSYIG